jgi:hypothetical protein
MKEKVRDFTLFQAKYFLNDAKEFYPFGTLLLTDGTLKPISAYLEGEYPDSSQLLKILEQDLAKRLLNKEILACAIGVDVYYRTSLDKEKVTAIEIRYADIEGSSINWYLPYFVNDSITYGEMVESEGSFPSFSST